MSIDFYCPGCGHLMRTPDATAGKKGRCPNCELKVQIPEVSIAAASSQNAIGTPPDVKIQFACQHCQKWLKVPRSNGGKLGRCPGCQQKMRIPTESQTPPRPRNRWRVAETASERIEFQCKTCGKQVKVAASAAGQRGKCPGCLSVIQIPAL